MLESVSAELAHWHGLKHGLVWQGREFPLVCRAAPRAQWDDVESVVGQVRETPATESPLAAEFAGRPMFNGEVYAMDRLRMRPRLRLDLRRGRYFDSMNTCEALETELRREQQRGAGWAGRLEKRRAAAARPWLDGRGRCAAVGVATLVAWRRPGRLDLLVARLGEKAMPSRAGGCTTSGGVKRLSALSR